MSNWSQRLQRVQVNLTPPAEEAIDHLSLEDLQEETITFGKTHVGQTYNQVWESSPDWIKWFTEHFSNSSKLAHRKVIRFIRLKIEEAEAEQGLGSQAPVLPKAKAKGLPKSLAAKAKSRPGPDLTAPIEIGSEVAEFMQGYPWVTQEHVQLQQENIQAMQERMSQLEQAMHQMIALMSQNQRAPEPTPLEEWDDPWNN